MSRQTWTDTSPLGYRTERPVCDWCGVKLYHESTRVRGSGLNLDGGVHHCDPAIVAQRALDGRLSDLLGASEAK